MSARAHQHRLLPASSCARVTAAAAVIAGGLALSPAASAAPRHDTSGAAPHATSAPFTIGLSAKSVAAGSRVLVSGLANARAGTQLTVLSYALSSTRLIGGVPEVSTPAFVEGTYRVGILVPPATAPGTYAVRLRVAGKQVAATSIKVTPRSGGSSGPANRACAGIGFTVLHDDQSAGVKLPAGAYRITSGKLDCATASADFTTFLNKYNGAIPGWSATSSGAGRGTFTQSRGGASFTVARTS